MEASLGYAVRPLSPRTNIQNNLRLRKIRNNLDVTNRKVTKRISYIHT